MVFLVLAVPPLSAAPVALETLVGGQTLECGNLKFSRFEYDRGASPGFAAAANIAVNCIETGLPGIRFDGLWSGTRNDGAVYNARLTYRLDVLNASVVSFAHLVADPTTTEDDVVTVGELLFTLPGDCPT